MLEGGDRPIQARDPISQILILIVHLAPEHYLLDCNMYSSLRDENYFFVAIFVYYQKINFNDEYSGSGSTSVPFLTKSNLFFSQNIGSCLEFHKSEYNRSLLCTRFRGVLGNVRNDGNCVCVADDCCVAFILPLLYSIFGCTTRAENRRRHTSKGTPLVIVFSLGLSRQLRTL